MKKEGSSSLFIVSGPSGTGKTTLCKELIKSIPDLSFSISYTTRPPRKNEVAGKDYNFVSPDKFKAMIANGEFAEWAEVYGHLYGTSRKSIEQALDKGLDLLFDLDCQGAQQLKKIYPQGIGIFLLPPSFSELEKRMKKRSTDSPETIRNRLSKACQEISEAKNYDYIVINDVFSETLHILQSIIIAEKHRSKKMLRYLTAYNFQL